MFTYFEINPFTNKKVEFTLEGKHQVNTVQNSGSLKPGYYYVINNKLFKALDTKNLKKANHSLEFDWLYYYTIKNLCLESEYDTINLRNLTGLNINVAFKSHRVQTLLRSNYCACCGIEGTHFKITTIYHEKTRRFETPHLNLYSDKGVMLTCDHIKPKSKGGTNSEENLQTLCTTCNAVKSDKEISLRTLDRWIRKPETKRVYFVGKKVFGFEIKLKYYTRRIIADQVVERSNIKNLYVGKVK